MSGLLQDRTILVTGVLTESSIAFAVARVAQQQGAEVILSSFGQASRITATVARRLPRPAPLVSLDVADPASVQALQGQLRQYADRLDGVVHAIAAAPAEAFDLMTAGWPEVGRTLQVSAFSLQALAAACMPLMQPGSAIVGLTFDGSRTWEGYDWMGVAKAALESTSRYCARALGPAGIRCNLVAAGPVRTPAASVVPGQRNPPWSERAPLGWDETDAEPVARACVALLSDWFPATSGEIVHVDGGAHIVGESSLRGADPATGSPSDTRL